MFVSSNMSLYCVFGCAHVFSPCFLVKFCEKRNEKQEAYFMVDFHDKGRVSSKINLLSVFFVS